MRHRHPLAVSVLTAVSIALTGATLCLCQRQAMQTGWPEERHHWQAVCFSEPKETERSIGIDALIGEQKVRLFLPKDLRSRALEPGQVITTHTRIKAPESRQTGSFDYGKYLLVHSYTGSAYCHDWQLVEHKDAAGFSASAAVKEISTLQRLQLRCLIWRHQLLQRFRLMQLEENDLAVLQAMTLGEKNMLSRELRDEYSSTGASHVLALSGLHLSIVACLLMLWVRRRQLLWLSSIVTLVIIWSFALLTGLSLSVMRSALMVSIYVIMQMGWRQASGMNSLALAALVILTVNPLSVLDVGFQLSFLSVAAILFLEPLMRSWLWSIFSVPIAAQVGTAPLVAYYFGRLPVYFLLVNLLAIPLTYTILCIGLLTLLLPALTAVTAPLLRILLHTLNAGISQIASWPGACIDNLHPTVLTVALVYVFLLLCYFLVVYLRKIFIHRAP